MSRSDRFREIITGPLTPEAVSQREQEGWQVYAVEWVREGTTPNELEETPYGLKVASDGRHLEEDPAEVPVMLTVLEGLVQDWSLTKITVELDRRGYRMRTGSAWTPGAVFDMLPRIIDFSPRLFAKAEWRERRGAVLQR
jgi:hypothetical protein